MVKCPFCKKEIGNSLDGFRTVVEEITVIKNDLEKHDKDIDMQDYDNWIFKCPKCDKILFNGYNSIDDAQNFLDTGKY